MDKNDYIIEVKREIFRLRHKGEVTIWEVTDSSIEYCYSHKMSVDEAVKTFF